MPYKNGKNVQFVVKKIPNKVISNQIKENLLLSQVWGSQLLRLISKWISKIGRHGKKLLMTILERTIYKSI